VKEVNAIVGELQMLEYESDSSGMSGTSGWGGPLKTLKILRMKSEGEHKNEDD
jgi:hypothetical protein